MNAVQLFWAIAGMSPTGTGSYAYFSNFRIVVDNIAYTKVVGIWGRAANGGVWSFYPASYMHSLAWNKELWQARVTEVLDRFVVKYEVLGATYWDNNGGHDYILDAAAAQSTDGVGTAIIGAPVVSQDNAFVSGSRLTLGISVQNLYYTKHVGVRFTTDNWATYHDALAVFQQSYKPELLAYQPQVESWYVDVPISAVSSSGLQYAVFFDDRWDNNFGANYGPVVISASAVQARSATQTAQGPEQPNQAWSGQALRKEPPPSTRQRPLRAN